MSIGQRIIEKREQEIEEERKKKAAAALETAYEKCAERQYGDAAIHGLASWIRFTDGLRPGRFSHREEYPKPVRDGFRILSKWHFYTRHAADRSGPDLTIRILEEAIQRVRGHMGLWLLDQYLAFPPEKQVPRGLLAIEFFAKAHGWIGDPGESTYTLGEDFEESELHDMYEKRRAQGRSLQGIIVARDNDTGTGKTTLAVGLCKKWGSDWGAENATNRPGEYRDFLNNKPEGSVLLADEIGQMYDSRRSMSSDNVEVSQDWQMIRTKRYVTLSTLPGPSFLDKRLKKLADVMILCTRRGHARVYRLKVDDQDGQIWREHICNVEWGAMDDDPDYQAVEEMKRERLKERFEGAGGDRDDGEPDQAAHREGRNETIRRLVENGMTQTDVADALDMDQSTVSRICRESSD